MLLIHISKAKKYFNNNSLQIIINPFKIRSYSCHQLVSNPNNKTFIFSKSLLLLCFNKTLHVLFTFQVFDDIILRKVTNLHQGHITCLI